MTDLQIEIIKDIKNIDIDEHKINNLGIFLDELLRWNKKINLTSIAKYDEAVEKHLIDSLYLSKYLKKQVRIIDMGSGAGLPGIPLVICRSDIMVLSIDSVGKKINFQKHIKRLLKLANFTPTNARVEGFARFTTKQNIDVVTARAFSSLEKLMKYSSPFLGCGDLLLAMKGVSEEDNLLNDRCLLAETGFSVQAVESYNLPISYAKRKIIVLEKTKRQ